MLRNQYEMRAAADLKMKIQLISRLTAQSEEEEEEEEVACDKRAFPPLSHERAVFKVPFSLPRIFMVWRSL